MSKVRTKKEAENVITLQREFPELNNGFSNGLTLEEIAEKIKHFNGKNHSFEEYSPNTLKR